MGNTESDATRYEKGTNSGPANGGGNGGKGSDGGSRGTIRTSAPKADTHLFVLWYHILTILFYYNLQVYYKCNTLTVDSVITHLSDNP